MEGRLIGGIGGTEGVGEGEVGVSGGEEGEFPEVLAAYGPHRAKRQIVGDVVCGDRLDFFFTRRANRIG